MVQDAQRLFGEGRYDEAAMIAVAILEQGPYCVEALAIKGDCHERLGEYGQALSCYREILKIDPDSQLDRIRVARLEKIVSSGEIEIGQPSGRRRTALGAAVAAAVLLVSSGSALILAAQNANGSTPSKTNAADHQSEPFLPIARVPGGSSYTPNQQAAPQDQTDSLDGLAGSGSVTPYLSPNDTPRIAPGAIPRNPGSLVDPGRTNTVTPDDVNVHPVNPNVRSGTGGPPGSGVGDPDPTVVRGGKGSDDGRNSIVDVHPSKGQGTGTSNQTADDRSERIDTLIRVAREQYVIGNYAKSADAYEKALALGATPSTTNQRLAQCYERLGKKQEAISAYERAIKAFELLDQNDERVRTQLEVCRTALNILRGN